MIADLELNHEGEGDHHDPHFEPIITLPEVKMPTMEEEEEVLIQLRAKLFRLDIIEREWKERGTGDVKLLHHEKKNTVRVVMRRDKTLKLCANHYVTSDMELKPNCGSDRAWVWTTMADYADGKANPEILAIKFLNSETANRWKNKFEEGRKLISETKEVIEIEKVRVEKQEKGTNDVDSDDDETSKDSKENANTEEGDDDKLTEEIENLKIQSNLDKTYGKEV